MGGDKIGHGSQGHYGQNKMEKQMVSVSDVYCAIKMQFIDGAQSRPLRLVYGGKIKMPMSGRFSRQNCRETFHSGSDNTSIMASTNLPLR